VRSKDSSCVGESAVMLAGKLLHTEPDTQLQGPTCSNSGNVFWLGQDASLWGLIFQTFLALEYRKHVRKKLPERKLIQSGSLFHPCDSESACSILVASSSGARVLICASAWTPASQ
jgi:hypothetical protein